MAKKHELIVPDNWQERVAFNLYAINAKDMTRLFDAMGDNNWDLICEVFARCLTDLPGEWGDMNNPDDLQNNIPYPCLNKMLTDIFVGQFNELQKK